MMNSNRLRYRRYVTSAVGTASVHNVGINHDYSCANNPFHLIWQYVTCAVETMSVHNVGVDHDYSHANKPHRNLRER
jgi:hypothetical protein